MESHREKITTGEWNDNLFIQTRGWQGRRRTVAHKSRHQWPFMDFLMHTGTQNKDLYKYGPYCLCKTTGSSRDFSGSLGPYPISTLHDDFGNWPMLRGELATTLHPHIYHQGHVKSRDSKLMPADQEGTADAKSPSVRSATCKGGSWDVEATTAAIILCRPRMARFLDLERKVKNWTFKNDAPCL